MTLNVNNQTALVTGGTSGIGLALVEALHARGVRVAFCARNAEAVAALQARLPGTIGYAADVTKGAALHDMARQFESVLGKLDILIANAGKLSEQDFTKAPLGDQVLQEDLDLNLTSVVLTINAFLPLLKKSAAPHIVAVGSGYGWSPVGRAPLYSASKAGVRAFVKALRAQLKPAGFHVMEVIPPVVDTPAVAHVSVKKLSPATLASAILRGIDTRKTAVFAGQTKAIPFMLRVAPAALERMTLRG